MHNYDQQLICNFDCYTLISFLVNITYNITLCRDAYLLLNAARSTCVDIVR